jgi:5-keto 4-deoxyuronate isomerase
MEIRGVTGYFDDMRIGRNTVPEHFYALELELEEREYDLRYTNVIYVGGGAVAVKYFSEHRANIAYA